MADTPSAATNQSGPEAAPERTVYGASGGRKTIFSFIFLILLPFFVSIPAMILTRFQHGLMLDNWGFLVLALAFAALMFLVLIELIFSLRARVELLPEKVRMTLPAGRGPTPMLRYKSYEVPYDQVHTVETRREVYGGAMVPVLLKGARLITKDGTAVPLGYVSEANVDPAFPYPVIAKQIADRARLPLIDRGNVRRSVGAKFLGMKSNDPVADAASMVDDNQLDALNQSHRNFVLGLIGVLVILIAIGIVDDLSEERLTDQASSAAATTNQSSALKKETPAAKTQKKTP
ncbi:MAG: hypothetical protein ABL894_00570 [Hyphomicrobium sp.]